MNSKYQKHLYFIKTVNIDLAYFSLKLQRGAGKKFRLSSFGSLLDGLYLSETPVMLQATVWILCTKVGDMLFSLHMKEMKNDLLFLFLVLLLSHHPQSPLGALLLSGYKVLDQVQNMSSVGESSIKASLKENKT